MSDLPGSAIVGMVSVKIVDSSTWRTGLFIRNMSDNNVSLGFGVAAEIDKGITLFPRESYSMSRHADYFTGDVYAIASADNSLVSFQSFSYGRPE
jgi:hypothetical protein